MLQKLRFEVMLLFDGHIWACLAVPFGRIAHWKASEARGNLNDLEHGRWCCHGCYDRWHHVAEALRSCCDQPCLILFPRLLRWRIPAVGTLVRAHTDGIILFSNGKTLRPRRYYPPPLRSLLLLLLRLLLHLLARARFLLCPQGKPVTRSAGLGNPSW